MECVSIDRVVSEGRCFGRSERSCGSNQGSCRTDGDAYSSILTWEIQARTKAQAFVANGAKIWRGGTRAGLQDFVSPCPVERVFLARRMDGRSRRAISDGSNLL